MDINEFERILCKHDIEVSSTCDALKAGNQCSLTSHLPDLLMENHSHPGMRLPETLHCWQTLEETHRGAEILPTAGRTLSVKSISVRMITCDLGEMSGEQEMQAPVLPTLSTCDDASV